MGRRVVTPLAAAGWGALAGIVVFAFVLVLWAVLSGPDDEL